MLQYSPKIITDSLVMCLDASQNKSYPAADLPVKNGLLLWLDASDDTTFNYSSGTEISQWRDKSGNNFHANQSTVANQPSRSNVVNSRKGVNFTSANGDFMRVSSGIVTPNYITLFAVIQPAAQDNSYAIIMEQDHGNGYNGWVIQRNGTTSYWQSWVSSAASAWLNPTQIAYTNSTPQIVTLRKNASTINLYSNGTSSGAGSISDTAITQTSYGLNLGYWQYGGGRYYNGTMCEILVFNRGLSDTELKQVNTYLGQKWGISNTDRSIVDLSNNNNNGLFGNATVANMPLYDFYNKGTLKFDGTNDYASGFGSSIVPTSTVQYTVSMWVYRTRNNVGYEELLSQWTSANSGNSFFFGFNNSNVRFTDNWNDVVVSGAGNTNIWMNLVGVYTVSNAFIYLNGVLVATRGSGFSYTGTGPLILGRQGELASEYFGGNISNVLIYNKALSATEVAQNYEAQKSKFANTIVQQGLVLNLDAGNIYSYGGAGTTWYDVSGNTKDFLVDGSGISYNSGGYFTLADGGITRSATITNSTTCTVVVWLRTTDTQSLIFKGNSNTSVYLAAYYVGQGFYSDNCGSPTYWIDTVSVSNPNPTYLDGNWHMWEMKNVNFSGWTSYEFNKYVGFTFGNGAVGQIMIYDRNLSNAESLQNYNATKGRFGL